MKLSTKMISLILAIPLCLFSAAVPATSEPLPSVRMDTRQEVSLETGGAYGFVVTVPPEQTPELNADGLQLREVARPSLAEGSRYYEVTALKAGSYLVSATCGEDTAAFPVTVTPSPMEEKVKPLESATAYLVMTDLAKQRVVVFQGKKDGWDMIQSYPCSSGTKGYETPTGEFRVTGRGSWFFNRSLQEGAKWYVQFKGNYLFHSFPMDRNQKVLDTRLGQPLSHGCVRLRLEDAKWLYDTLPDNTKVLIY